MSEREKERKQLALIPVDTVESVTPLKAGGAESAARRQLALQRRVSLAGASTCFGQRGGGQPRDADGAQVTESPSKDQ